jgi:hypothetical protein
MSSLWCNETVNMSNEWTKFNLSFKIFNYMLVQQLKQIQDRLKKLKSQEIISEEDSIEIQRIEKWFEEFKKAE